MSEKILVIRGDEITALYSDELRELGGTLHVERASHVEFDEARQGWTIELADGSFIIGEGSGMLFVSPQRERAKLFATRDEALVAEVAFIQARL